VARPRHSFETCFAAVLFLPWFLGQPPHQGPVHNDSVQRQPVITSLFYQLRVSLVEKVFISLAARYLNSKVYYAVTNALLMHFQATQT